MEELAARFRAEMIPLTGKFSYFSTLPMAEDDLKQYLNDPIAAISPAIVAALPPMGILSFGSLELQLRQSRRIQREVRSERETKMTPKKFYDWQTHNRIQFLFVTTLFLSAQGAVSTNDSILAVPYLQSNETSKFSANDGIVSPFWNNWSGRDSILMTRGNCSYPGHDQWSGDLDANVTVKAGADDRGLYVYFNVEDNVFLDPVNDDVHYDCCEIFLDALTADSISKVGADQLANQAWGWVLTLTSQQFRNTLRRQHSCRKLPF